jgi:TRAP-type uncharacterized transport system fused permease subunit
MRNGIFLKKVVFRHVGNMQLKLSYGSARDYKKYYTNRVGKASKASIIIVALIFVIVLSATAHSKGAAAQCVLLQLIHARLQGALERANNILHSVLQFILIDLFTRFSSFLTSLTNSCKIIPVTFMFWASLARFFAPT